MQLVLMTPEELVTRAVRKALGEQSAAAPAGEDRLTTKQAAAVIGVRPKTLAGWIRSGRHQASRPGAASTGSPAWTWTHAPGESVLFLTPPWRQGLFPGVFFNGLTAALIPEFEHLVLELGEFIDRIGRVNRLDKLLSKLLDLRVRQGRRTLGCRRGHASFGHGRLA
jgi:hypothetical protein